MGEVIKRRKPIDETLYFVCWQCGTEYSEKKSNCKWEDADNQYDSGWRCKCPDCETENGGMHRETYMRYYFE